MNDAAQSHAEEILAAAPELDAAVEAEAAELAELVRVARAEWWAAWDSVMVTAGSGKLDALPDAPPGSVRLRIEERVIATFAVRFVPEAGDVEIKADWPRDYRPPGGVVLLK